MVEHVARIGEKGISYRILIGKLLLGIYRRRKEDNIKMHVKYISCEDLDFSKFVRIHSREVLL
jgi:hypothetical protein